MSWISQLFNRKADQESSGRKSQHMPGSRITDLLLRVFAILFSLIGFYLLLRRVDFAFHWIPLPAYGAEGGIIEIALDTFVGAGCTLVALTCACIGFFRVKRSRGARIVLAWCLLLLGGFAGTLLL